MKGQMHIRIDQQIHDKLKAKYGDGELSRVLRCICEGLVASGEEVNKQVLKLELDATKEKMDKITSEYYSLKSQYDSILEREKEAELKKLKAKQNEIETASRCIQCSSVITAEYKEFPAGKVCTTCFKTTPPMEAKEWNVQEDLVESTMEALA